MPEIHPRLRTIGFHVVGANARTGSDNLINQRIINWIHGQTLYEVEDILAKSSSSLLQIVNLIFWIFLSFISHLGFLIWHLPFALVLIFLILFFGFLSLICHLSFVI